jgi:hypothetical protein
MHNLIRRKLGIFKKRKVENILAQNFVLFLCFIFSWEQTLRFRFENISLSTPNKSFLLQKIEKEIEKN